MAAECRSALWSYLAREHGILESEPATWSRAPRGRLGIAEVFQGNDLGAPWAACWSEQLRSAVDLLCGSGRWKPTGCGWWVISFPGVANPPWGAEGSWHVDGHGYQHVAQSPEVGLVLMFLFSDVQEHGGGTALAPRSHSTVADLLLCAGDAGVAGPKLSAAARQRVDLHNIIEATGRAGDVLLAHPFLLHARSKNLNNSVRFMCHPVVPLYEPLRLFPHPPDPTPVERVALNACQDLERQGMRIEPFEGSAMSLSPLECRKRKDRRYSPAPAFDSANDLTGDSTSAVFAAMGFASFASGRRCARRRR